MAASRILSWLRSLPGITTVLTLLGAGTLWVIPGTRAFLREASACLIALDVPGLRDVLLPFESTAWIVSSFLMVFQSLAAPIPAFPITLANALLYGTFWGTVISWSSAQLAAMLCFFLARGLGRPFVQRLFPERHLQRFDGFFSRYGILAVMVARLIPVVSFDVISYGAGVTHIRPWRFFLATGIGQLPACVIYSYAGAHLADSPGRSVQVVMWFVGLAVLVSGIVWLRQRKPSTEVSVDTAEPSTTNPRTENDS